MGLDTLSLDNGCSGSKDDAEELVGMGLYDSPAEVQSSSLLFNGFSRSGRKVLKLEESFEPEEREEEEDEEDDDEESLGDILEKHGDAHRVLPVRATGLPSQGHTFTVSLLRGRPSVLWGR